MALLEVFGFYVAAAVAFYGYIVRTAGAEERTQIIRRVRWHRSHNRGTLRARHAHHFLSGG